MPGVADTIRRTQMKQSKIERKKDMEELIRLVEEGRLHEADERQLENLELHLKLNAALNLNIPTSPKQEVAVDTQALQQLINQTLQKALTSLPISNGTVIKEERPTMDRASLASMHQGESNVKISGESELGEKVSTKEENVTKLEKLRKLKSYGK